MPWQQTFRPAPIGCRPPFTNLFSACPRDRGVSINSLLIEGAELRLALLGLEHLSLAERTGGIMNTMRSMAPLPARDDSVPEMHFTADEGGMCPWPDKPNPANHPSWCTLSNRLRIRQT